MLASFLSALRIHLFSALYRNCKRQQRRNPDESLAFINSFISFLPSNHPRWAAIKRRVYHDRIAENRFSHPYHRLHFYNFTPIWVKVHMCERSPKRITLICGIGKSLVLETQSHVFPQDVQTINSCCGHIILEDKIYIFILEF